jgi:hypothetical protein
MINLLGLGMETQTKGRRCPRADQRWSTNLRLLRDESKSDAALRQDGRV